MVDSGDAATVDVARDDPPSLVRAGLVRNLALGWQLTGDRRYRDAARLVLQRLARDLGGAADGAVFADREAYVIGSVLDAAPGVDDSAAARRALRALDELLRRTYARNRGARHTPGGAGVHGLLQDQVQVAGACLAAYGYQGARRYLDVAADLAHVLDRDFADSVGGGYFDAVLTDPVPPAVADRSKPLLHHLLPGANAWAAHVLLQLAEATGDARYRRPPAATPEAVAGGPPGQDVPPSGHPPVR